MVNKELAAQLRKYPERLLAAYTLDREFAAACHQAAAVLEKSAEEPKQTVNIQLLRALAVATNSLRYNGTLDHNEIVSYENLLTDLREELGTYVQDREE